MGLKTIGRFVTSTSSAVAAGGTVPLAVSTATCNLTCDGASVTVNQGGVFLATVAMTMTADAGGEVQTRLLRDGSQASGATATTTAAADGDYVAQSYTALFTVPKCGQAVLSIEAVDAVTVESAQLLVVKLA